MLALRVERQQLAGQLADGVAGTGLDQLPGAAAELREGGRPAVGADVPRHLAHLIVRDVQAVLPAERKQQVVASDPADRLRLEAEQLPDAVILVDDVVARPQICERPQCPRDACLARRSPAEDLRLRYERDAELAPDEAPAGGRHGKQQRPVGGEGSTRLQQLRVGSPEQALRAERVAAVWKGDEDSKTRPGERIQLALRLGEPSRG